MFDSLMIVCRLMKVIIPGDYNIEIILKINDKSVICEYFDSHITWLFFKKLQDSNYLLSCQRDFSNCQLIC